MFRLNIKFKRTVDIKALLANNLVDSELVDRVQREVIDETIKPLIASGVSPVEYSGSRRFKKYKDPKKYPANQKAKTPVNLFLSGVMLSYYKAYAIGKNILRVGIPSYAPEEVKVRAEAHNDGAFDKEGTLFIPVRRFIPLKGETFRISVMRRLKNIYAEKIARLLSTKK